MIFYVLNHTDIFYRGESKTSFDPKMDQVLFDLAGFR